MYYGGSGYYSAISPGHHQYKAYTLLSLPHIVWRGVVGDWFHPIWSTRHPQAKKVTVWLGARLVHEFTVRLSVTLVHCISHVNSATLVSYPTKNLVPISTFLAMTSINLVDLSRVRCAMMWDRLTVALHNDLRKMIPFPTLLTICYLLDHVSSG